METGKKVHLNLMGENTELDKKVVDMIGEPMLHLIRNSIDHGIETPAERAKAGKPEYGTVELNAYQGGKNHGAVSQCRRHHGSATRIGTRHGQLGHRCKAGNP